jgi:hypothetical protein
VFGARAVQQTIIESFPHAQISVNIVWIDMLAGDNESAARQSAQIVRDPRVAISTTHSGGQVTLLPKDC